MGNKVVEWVNLLQKHGDSNHLPDLRNLPASLVDVDNNDVEEFSGTEPIFGNDSSPHIGRKIGKRSMNRDHPTYCDLVG